jgi:hypothetical protein
MSDQPTLDGLRPRGNADAALAMKEARHAKRET